MTYKILCLLQAVIFTSGLFAQDEIKIKPLRSEIIFDGIPSEPAWKLSKPIPLVMHYPVFNNKPTEKSEVYMTFDDHYLWIGASLYYENISEIVSTSKKRDEISENSDSFGLLLDSYNDNENGMAFFTMPSGLKIDYTVSNDATIKVPGSEIRNYTWNTFWDIKTVTDSNAWYIEIRIPFSSLRFQTVNDITRMGLIITRKISHSNEINTFPPIDTKYGENATIKPSLAKTIIFESIKPHNPLYMSPYLIGGISGAHEENENGIYEKSEDPEFSGGLDVKYNLNNNLTLDFTVNTDFAQVEADDEQINLTRYSLFFPEKRLFFQERSGIFSYDLVGTQNLFYSRNIGISDGNPVNIPGGVRLVGRLNKWDIGFLNMNTAKFDGNPAENFGVARLRKQVFNENSYLGGMLTSRIGFDGNYNVAYGLDGIFKVINDDFIDIKIAGTRDKNISGDPLSLNSAFISLGIERRSEEGFSYDAKYAYWGKDFHPASGFLFMSNIHQVVGNVVYGIYPGEKSKVFSYSGGIDYEMISRIADGKIENMEISPEFDINFKNGYAFFSAFTYREEGVLNEFYLTKDVTVPPGTYKFTGIHGHMNSPRTKKFVAEIEYETGGFFDGSRYSLKLNPELNVSSSLQLSAGYQIDHVDFSERSQSFTNNIGRVKAIYMVNTKLSLSTFMQYNQIDNILITNFRLHYNPRDGNNFYLVFNDVRNAEKQIAGVDLPPYLNLTLLLKYTYTFQL